MANKETRRQYCSDWELVPPAVVTWMLQQGTLKLVIGHLS